MIFCPKCGSILKPKEKAGKKSLWCSCGFTNDLDRPGEETKKTKESPEISEETKTSPKKKEETLKEKTEEPARKTTRKIGIVEELETHPKIKANCEKCQNKEAYYWTQQTRGADEPETRFFKCTNCKHTWREYA